MAGLLMHDWLQLFYDHIGGEIKVLLLMDNFSAHRVGLRDNPPPDNIRIEVLPARSTSVFQPLDEGKICNTKVHYLEHLLAEQRLTFRAARICEESGVEIPEEKPKISIRDAVWWLHDAWVNKVTPTTIQNCFRKSTLYDENYPQEEFVRPEPSEQLRSFYTDVVNDGRIQDAMSLSEVLSPEGEDSPPSSAMPTIGEIVNMYSPITEEDEANEEVQESDKAQVVDWKAGVRSASHILSLLSLINDDTSEFKGNCRRMLETFARNLNQTLVQKSIMDFAPFGSTMLTALCQLQLAYQFVQSQTQSAAPGI
ncbi:hypothetical protein JCM33374_g5107 [Metschnikowia sp. JCM 33374]|nr:hypothetical protein JCM33374_g5107 [Metschnikowia sp. JCM 33374]